MHETFPTNARAFLENARRDPRLRALSRIPLLAIPTTLVIAAAYALCLLSAWGFVTRGWPAWLAMVVSAVGIYLSFTPFHDAVHRAVSRNGVLNDRLGDLSAALLFPGLGTRVYRRLHLEHHHHIGEADLDPDDAFVSAPRWLRPLVWIAVDVHWAIWVARRRQRYPRRFLAGFALGLSLYVAWHVAWLASDYAGAFIVVWMIPQRAALFSLAYLFAAIQHPPGMRHRREPLQATAMIAGGGWKGVALLGQNRHLVHHMLPRIPFYRYHRAWRASEPLLRGEAIAWRGIFSDGDGPAPAPMVSRAHEGTI